MSFLARLQGLFRRVSATTASGVHRVAASPNGGSSSDERALRRRLGENPNDKEAFHFLADLVRRGAAEAVAPTDPLSAPVDEATKQRAADLAVWSLAEELAGNPKGWYPLIELGRLSLDDDKEGALRRFGTAAERDPSGIALAQSLEVLREAGMPGEALGLGVGHWRVREHDPEVGRQIVLAAIDADRTHEARQQMAVLEMSPEQDRVRAIEEEVLPRIVEAESSAS